MDSDSFRIGSATVYPNLRELESRIDELETRIEILERREKRFASDPPYMPALPRPKGRG